MKKITIIFILITSFVVTYSKNDFGFIIPNNSKVLNNSTINLGWDNNITDDTFISYYNFELNDWVLLDYCINKNQLKLDINDTFKDSILFKINTTYSNKEIKNIKVDDIEISVFDSYNNNFVYSSNKEGFGVYHNNIKYEFQLPVIELKYLDAYNILIGTGKGKNAGVYKLNIISNEIKKFGGYTQNCGIGIFKNKDIVVIGNNDGVLSFYKKNGSFISKKSVYTFDSDIISDDNSILYNVTVKEDNIITIRDGNISSRTLDSNFYIKLNVSYISENFYNIDRKWNVDLIGNHIVSIGDDTIRIYKEFDTEIQKILYKLKMKGDIKSIVNIDNNMFAVGGLLDSNVYIYNVNGEMLCKIDVGCEILSMSKINNKIYGGSYSKYFILELCELYTDYVKVYIQEHKTSDKILNYYTIIENYSNYELFNINGNKINDIYNASSGIYIMVLNDNEIKWLVK